MGHIFLSITQNLSHINSIKSNRNLANSANELRTDGTIYHHWNLNAAILLKSLKQQSYYWKWWNLQMNWDIRVLCPEF